MKIHKARPLFCSAMLVALAPTTVAAQSTPPTAPEQASQDPSVPAVAGDDDRSVAAGDIVVTAQRRQERLIDVPISVTALSGSALEQHGITDTLSLSKLTPGLRMDHNGPYTQPAMRGVSSTLTQAGTESPVAIYVDGVYQLSQTGLNFELPDIRSVEVLKGPQGTLFGRNATGGAIQVFTLDPKDQFGGKIFSSYGNYNDVRIDGFVTGPLAEGVSFSLSGSVHNNDGYLYDIVNKRPAKPLKSHLVRGKLRLTPTDNLTVMVTGFYSKRNSSAVAGQALNGNSVARFNPGAILATRPYDFAGTDPYTNTKNYGGSLKVDLETGIGTFSALTGYSYWKTDTLSDNDRIFVPNQIGAYAIPHSQERVLSQELNFASRKFGRLSFVAGLFYYNAFGRAVPQEVRADFPVVINTDTYGNQPIKAAAAYGEFTFEVTDRLTAIAGIRYSTEKRSLYGTVVAGNVAPGPLLFLDSRRDSSFTPRASLKYQITDQSNLYFTFSRGFKSGAYNTTSIVPFQTVSPETITAYEVGSKSQFGALSLNVASFYYDYKNLQVSAGAISSGGSVLQRLQNAASARIYGLDLESGLNVSDALRFSLGVSLLNAKYKSFPLATINIPRANGAGNIQTTGDAKGNYLNRAPKATFNFTAEYTTQLAGGDLTLSSSVYYSSHYFFEASNRIVQPKYAQLDARVSWSPSDTNLTFAVYGNNLTNKAVLNNAFPTAFSDAVAYAPPRTYGVSASYKF